MCGIVGMFTLAKNGFGTNDLDIFEEMLYVDALRGIDSTGVFCVSNRNGISGIKHASHPHNTMNSEAWRRLRSDAIRNGSILIGHNRKATSGKVNNENSHPFYEKHITLVHNGMLHATNNLPERDVDSNAFAAKLADTSPEDVPQLIADTDGAFAFIWYDSKQKKLFVTRNRERPLHVLRYWNKFVFSSEAWIASGCIRRNERTLGQDMLKVYEVPVDKLFSYDLEGNLETIDIPAPSKKASATMTNGQVIVASKDSITPRGTTANVVPFEHKQTNIRSFGKHDFEFGEDISVQVHKVQDIPGQGQGKRRLRFMGNVKQIGKPGWDVTGLLPPDVDVGDVQDYMGRVIIGKVMDINAHLAAGPSLTVRDVVILQKHHAIESWNGMRMTDGEWKHIEKICRCKHCSAKVMPYEREFTNVKFDNIGNIETICADCVEDRIENVEVKNNFVTDRIAAMDNYVPSSEKSAIGVAGNNTFPSPESLQ